MGILIGIAARRAGAVTYLDLFRARYESKAIVLILAVLVTLYLIPYMATQFVGAARVIGQMTGMSYIASLALGSLVVLVYCVLGGVALAGIVAGIQTTVAAMAILITSSVARNVVQELNIKLTPGQNKVLSRVTMAVCLGLAILLALAQPKLIQWIILFSVGGLEAATFAPILLGVFWRRGTSWGALAAICCGTISYVLAFVLTGGSMVFGMHPSVPAVGLSIVVYVLVSLVTPPPSEAVVRTFWGGSKATSS